MGEYFENYFSNVEDSANWLLKKVNKQPKLAVVLTGGVNGPIKDMTDIIEVSATEVPNFPTARAEGHAGKLYFGKYYGNEIVVLKGRYHFYEGHSPQQVVFPYFVLNKLGVKSLITTNAVGGIRKDLNAGDIMLVTDHINAMWNNPLRGIAIQRDRDQFTSMTTAYSEKFAEIAESESEKLNIKLKKGIYIATPGPSYETKTEVAMFREWGGDAVGMSTVFEVIACNFLKIEVLAFSCIANPAADRHDGIMSHEEVLNAMNAAGPKLSSLVNACAKRIAAN